MPQPRYLLVGSGSAIAAALADYVIGWEVAPNPIYFVPIGLLAWWGSRRIAIYVALIASLAFAIVEGLGAHPAPPTGSPILAVVLQLAGCVGVAMLVDGARRLVQVWRQAPSPTSVDERAVHARARMRSLNPDGTPRACGNMSDRT